MMKKLLIFIHIFLLNYTVLSGQDKLNLSGYVSFMGSDKTELSDSLFPPTGKNNYKDALIHNRINLFYYPNNNFEISVQVRNRIIWDETFVDIPDKMSQYDFDPGFMQMSFNILEEEEYLLNTNVDRLYVKYTFNNLEIKVGRQRINWSQSFAWNPNDIFNTSSYFDFDYAEKPGSDALRLQYYTGMASSAEAVVKIDHEHKVTAAALYKHNIKGYDVQVLSGIMNQEEFVIGSGWAGNIKNAGFRGEITGILPYKDSSVYNHPMNNLIMATVSFDYSFSNSAYALFEVLYSNNDIGALSTGFSSFLSGPTTVRNLAFARVSSLASVSYPVHPLINVSLSGMCFYKLSGYYIGPNVDYSVTDNINLSLYWQYFKMFLSKEKMLMTDDIAINYIFFRLKYNF